VAADIMASRLCSGVGVSPHWGAGEEGMRAAARAAGCGCRQRGSSAFKTLITV
jgi:hypothetical protein